MAPVIIARDLHKAYPGFPPVLRGVSIEVEPGEMVAIMGPSGCGKSTMLHILGMLHTPDSGSLEILGVDVLTLTREGTAEFRRGNMGFVMQSSNLFEHSTVFENVEFPLIYENVPPRERWERVIRALDLVRLSGRVHYRSNRLSGGEQQRVAIARAMVNNPRVLLADEPTGALDARTSVLIMENFRNLCHSGGVALVMVTHDPKMAEYCDTVYTLEEGALNCKKRGKPPFAAKTGIVNLLAAPEPLARGALVAFKFPDPRRPEGLDLATRMYGARLLAIIYALAKSGFLENPEGYSLPLAVRHVGFLRGLRGLAGFFRADVQSLRSLWGELPRGNSRSDGFCDRIKAFTRGLILAKWGREDNVEFFYAAGAGIQATAAWVASRLAQVPFAFSLRGEDMAHYGPDMAAKARGAILVACPSQAIREKFLELAPDLPPEKIILWRDRPLAEGGGGETARLPGQALEILVDPRWPMFGNLKIALGACAILKRLKINFRLVLPGRARWRDRWRISRAGLRGLTTFTGIPAADNRLDLLRAADIFIVLGNERPGWNLALPAYVGDAMAQGLAIAVCGLTKGLSEALNRGNALISPGGDIAALADSLRQLASSQDTREKLGAAARRDIAILIGEGGVTRQLADRVVMAVGLNERESEKKNPGGK